MVKGSSQESLQKKKKSVQYQFNSSSKLKDNVSQISNISKASSQHSRSSKSKSKLSKSNALNATQVTSKEDALKKMAKPSQSKSGLVKCKSAKLVGPFGK